ncbi:MAG: TfoX/Sxy family protein [Deltaproteobacteria bacterium]|nr:TfoX/Sxy family protein [Deltaproteobacteria bacterium]
MEKPNANTVAWYDRSTPADPRAVRGQMFGHPCAFVNGNMFFGTFAQTLIVRLGEARAASVATGNLRVFEPMPGKPWKEYVQVPAGAMADEQVATLAREALDYTAGLPAKKKTAKK